MDLIAGLGYVLLGILGIVVLFVGTAALGGFLIMKALDILSGMQNSKNKEEENE